ncbi:MAG: excalibur calcium-binding domain-containing protein [Pseudoxanthomonas sp.]
MKKLLILALLGAVAWFWQGRHKPSVSESVVTYAAQPAPPSEQFKCDGRTHCSQMRSCAEATYFIKHCPNTKMDGNGDGVPCERQWCN